MPGEFLGAINGAAVFEIRSNAGRAKGVTAGASGNASIFGTAPDPEPRIDPCHGVRSERTGATFGGAEQRSRFVVRNFGYRSIPVPGYMQRLNAGDLNNAPLLAPGEKRLQGARVSLARIRVGNVKRRRTRQSGAVSASLPFR